MKASEIVRKSLSRYIANPVLLIPQLVVLIVSALTSILFQPPAQDTLKITSGFLMTAFGVLFLLIAVNFLVLLGQINMTGKVVAGKKACLQDWSEGITKYFLRGIALGLVILGVVMVLFMLVGVLFILTALPTIISPEGAIKPTPTPTGTPAIIVTFVTTFLVSTAFSLFYMWLAPLVIDNKTVGGSLDSGTKAARKSMLNFLWLLVLVFIVSACVEIIRSYSSYMGITTQPTIGALTLSSLVSQIIEKLFSPLWFLIAFRIYKASPK